LPDISLKDNLDLNLDVEPGKDSAIAKYFKSALTFLSSDGKLRQYAPLSLSDPAFTSLHAGLNVVQPLAITGDGVSLTLKDGMSAGIDVFVPDPHLPAGETDSLFSPDNDGEDVPVKQSERYVSLSLIASAGPAASVDVSDVDLGFAADSSVTIANYQKFSVASELPTLLNAVKQTLASFQIPASVADLAAMLPDSIATAAGAGALKFSGSANLLAASNPLAVAHLPGPFGAIRISQGASFRVGASFRLFGDYELRVRKTSTDTVRFGYFKEHGKEWKASASASAGLALSFDGNDLLGQVISALSLDPEADFNELKNAGLDTATAESIQATVKAAVERTLEIGASYELGRLSARQAAFLYEIDLGALDQDGERAVSRALRGDLTAIAGKDEAMPRGIKMVHSIFTNLRQAKRTFKVNLLGIYNFISISKLTAKGKILYDPESGELILSDSVTATKIQAGSVNAGRPNQADSNAVRTVMASSLLITAAYRASQTIVNPPTLKSSQVYCEVHDQTSRDTMASELGIAVALGLMTRAELDGHLNGAAQFGRTVAYASADYNDSLATGLFIHNDQPRALTEYEDIGRYAMQAVARGAGAGDPVRLRPLQNDDLWKQMKAAGQSKFHALLPGATDLQIGAVVADFSTITWWAETMSETAQALVNIRTFLVKNPGVDPKNAEFLRLRSDLAKRLERVAAETKEEFGRPWGLIAMDLLTGNRSDAHVTFTGPVISWTKARAIAAAAAGRQMI
jgi:hypothetical protein